MKILFIELLIFYQKNLISSLHVEFLSEQIFFCNFIHVRPMPKIINSLTMLI